VAARRFRRIARPSLFSPPQFLLGRLSCTLRTSAFRAKVPTPMLPYVGFCVRGRPVAPLERERVLVLGLFLRFPGRQAPRPMGRTQTTNEAVKKSDLTGRLIAKVDFLFHRCR